MQGLTAIVRGCFPSQNLQQEVTPNLTSSKYRWNTRLFQLMQARYDSKVSSLHSYVDAKIHFTHEKLMLETETDFWVSIKSKLLHIKHCSFVTLLLSRTFSLHEGVLVSRRLLHFRTKVENRMAPQVFGTWSFCNKQVSAVPRWLQQTNERSHDPQKWLVLK